MRIGIVSDVHCNWPAFRSVLEDMEERGVEVILSCGDVFGYYPFIKETFEIFKKRDIKSVMGNHDHAILNDNYSELNSLANVTDPWTRRHLPRGAKTWLKGLPFRMEVEAGGYTLVFHHANPYDLRRYVHEEDVTERLLEDARADILFLGHTHRPMAVKVGTGLVANPGSVGQPRDRDPRASYGILDITDEKADFKTYRVKYLIDEVRERVEREGLPDLLWQRLVDGR